MTWASIPGFVVALAALWAAALAAATAVVAAATALAWAAALGFPGFPRRGFNSGVCVGETSDGWGCFLRKLEAELSILPTSLPPPPPNPPPSRDP